MREDGRPPPSCRNSEVFEIEYRQDAGALKIKAAYSTVCFAV